MYRLIQNQFSIKKLVILNEISLTILFLNMISLDQVKINKSIVDNVFILGRYYLIHYLLVNFDILW